MTHAKMLFTRKTTIFLVFFVFVANCVFFALTTWMNWNSSDVLKAKIPLVNCSRVCPHYNEVVVEEMVDKDEGPKVEPLFKKYVNVFQYLRSKGYTKILKDVVDLDDPKWELPFDCFPDTKPKVVKRSYYKGKLFELGGVVYKAGQKGHHTETVAYSDSLRLIQMSMLETLTLLHLFSLGFRNRTYRDPRRMVYSLHLGNLLAWIRDGSIFLPWDDDVDIQYRVDFASLLLELWTKGKRCDKRRIDSGSQIRKTWHCRQLKTLFDMNLFMFSSHADKNRKDHRGHYQWIFDWPGGVFESLKKRKMRRLPTIDLMTCIFKEKFKAPWGKNACVHARGSPPKIWAVPITLAARGPALHHKLDFFPEQTACRGAMFRAPRYDVGFDWMSRAPRYGVNSLRQKRDLSLQKLPLYDKQ